jgi:tetratricopeptide (TPR) repeat protein
MFAARLRFTGYQRRNPSGFCVSACLWETAVCGPPYLIAVIAFLLILLTPPMTLAQKKGGSLFEQLERAAALISDNRIQEAERELNQILKIKPSNALALNLLGAARAKQGRFDEAEALFSRALRVDNKFVGARMNLAHLYLIKGAPGKAGLHLKEVLRLEPDNEDARYKLARLLFSQGRLDECVGFIEKSIQSRQPTLLSLALLGDAYLKKGDLEKAENSYLLALNAQSSNIDALIGLALVSKAKGNVNIAALYLSRVKELITTSPELLYRFAVAALKSEFFEDAKQALERAVELRPNEPAYFVALGAVWLKKPDLFEAERVFRQAIQLQPDNAQAQMYLGYTLLKQKRHPEAREWLEKSAQKDASAPETFYYLGLIAQEQNEDQKAILLFEKAIKLLPSFANAHIALGATYLKLKNYRRALAELEIGVKLKPDDSKAHYNLARLYAQLKDHRRAQEEMLIVEKLKNAGKGQDQDGDVQAPSSPR